MAAGHVNGRRATILHIFLLLWTTSLISQAACLLPVSHFTITALGDLVPSGYTGYKYSIRFLIKDKFNHATLTRCTSTWKKMSKFPSRYITCDDPNWQWHYNDAYAECGFSLSLAHSVITVQGDTRTNTTSYGSLLPTQVPCEVGASRNFTCIYGTTGAQLCGLGQGTILQVPVRDVETTTTKIKPAKGKKIKGSRRSWGFAS